MNKSLKLRLFGGTVILFNLWLAGHYNIEGAALLMITFGFAVGYELVVVRAVAKLEDGGSASDGKGNTSPAIDAEKSGTAQHRTGRLDDDAHGGLTAKAVQSPSISGATKAIDQVLVTRSEPDEATVKERNGADEAQGKTPLQNSVTCLDDEQEEFWATAMSEVEGQHRRPGVWAKVFAETNGDEAKAKVAYLKVRVQQLIDASDELTKRSEAAKLVELAAQRVVASDRAQAIESASNLFIQTGHVSTEDLKLMVTHGDLSRLIELQDRRHGNSLLHICAEADLYDEVGALLRAGADAGRANGNGQKPIHLTNNSGIRLQLS